MKTPNENHQTIIATRALASLKRELQIFAAIEGKSLSDLVRDGLERIALEKAEQYPSVTSIRQG